MEIEQKGNKVIISIDANKFLDQVGNIIYDNTEVLLNKKDIEIHNLKKEIKRLKEYIFVLEKPKKKYRTLTDLSEIEINETAEYKGELIKCIIDDGCSNCVFTKKGCTTLDIKDCENHKGYSVKFIRI